MRSETEMMGLILDTAKKDARVRAVTMNGSRVMNKKQDKYQDFDIVYFVNDPGSFIKNPDWIDVFGDRLYMQTKDDQIFDPSGLEDDHYIYLILFRDGNRLDLSLCKVDSFMNTFTDDPMVKVLLDKDERLSGDFEPDDSHFNVKKPDETLFSSCVIETLFVSTNVAKGLWREEPTYALEMLSIIRRCLRGMLGWHAGLDHGFSVSVGKFSKHLDKYLDKDLYQGLLDTYVNADINSVWAGLFTLLETFDASASYVAEKLGYSYKPEETKEIIGYLQRVRQDKNE